MAALHLLPTLLPLLLTLFLSNAAFASPETVGISNERKGSSKLMEKLSLNKPLSELVALYILRENKNDTGLAPKGFSTCNIGFPASAVLPGFEQVGVSSGAVLLLLTSSSFDDVYGTCSGVLIAPNLVATAAQCIYDTDKNKWLLGSGVTLLALSRQNGAADKVYSFGEWESVKLFTAFQNAPTFSSTLKAGSDVAVVKLDTSLVGQVHKWASAASGTQPRAIFGYPAATQNGVTLVTDVTDVPLSRGCEGLSANILCERVSVERGMAGGPLVSPYQSPIAVGVLSAAASACPALYTALTGTYPLQSLVTGIGCNARFANGAYSATC